MIPEEAEEEAEVAVIAAVAAVAAEEVAAEEVVAEKAAAKDLTKGKFILVRIVPRIGMPYLKSNTIKF